MYGTTKQIAWAKDIINQVENAFDDLEAEFGPAPDEVREFIKGIAATENAKTLIDGALRYVQNANDLSHYFAVHECEAGDAACDWLQIM